MKNTHKLYKLFSLHLWDISSLLELLLFFSKPFNTHRFRTFGSSPSQMQLADAFPMATIAWGGVATS